MTIEDIDIWPQRLRDNAKVLSTEEKALAMDMITGGQHHLFASWDPPGECLRELRTLSY